ncbi:MAG: ATP-binding cassette domain-containing protein [Cyclobacteriaceae bacterium]|nr:ATP-binding cassette domain-containing protein [Cyclobacteriaceae bacterium]
MLQLKHFSKSYGSTPILDIDDFQLEKGLYWLQGPNGTGKSTFFKCISGIISFEGDCVLEETNSKKHPVAYRKKISYCEAEPEFPDFLTQKDLIGFLAKARNATQQQIEHLQEVLGTDGYTTQPVGTYSSGMLKKTGLLLALLGTPKLIVLDEPFTAIDHGSVDKLVQLVDEYQQAYGTSFLVSSHIDSGHYHLPFDKVYKIDNKAIIEA